MNARPIVAGFDGGAEGAQAGGNGGDAIRLLDPQRGETSEQARAIGASGENHGHDGGVGHAGVIGIVAAQRFAGAHAGGVPDDLDARAAHGKIVEESDVRLRAVTRKALKRHGGSAEHRRGSGIHRARCIGLDVDGATDDRLRGNGDARESAANAGRAEQHGAANDFEVHAGGGEGGEGKFEVGRAGRLVGEMDVDAVGERGRDEHQRADELARCGGADVDAPAAKAAAADAHGKAHGKAHGITNPMIFRMNLPPKRAQHGDTFGDWSFTHARARVDDARAAPLCCGERKHEARWRAAVAEIHRRVALRSIGAAIDDEIAAIDAMADRAGIERREQAIAIVAGQQSTQPRRTTRERRQNQVPIGKALRPGNADRRRTNRLARERHRLNRKRIGQRCGCAQPFSRRKTATTSSTGITNRRLSPSKSTGMACLGLKSTRSYCLIG